MKKICLVALCFLAFSGNAAESAKSKKSANSVAAPTKKSAQAASKDWTLIECGQDLKKLFENIEAYQKKLVSVANPLPLQTRQELYAGESIFAESLTLLSPEVFWKDIIASRQSVGCHANFKHFKKALSTNDSIGTPKRLANWNKCVMVLYGALPRQTQQINACVKQGLAFIKTRQKSVKK